MSEMDALARRHAAWQKLFEAARECRDLLLEDNGGTRVVNPDDTWLAYMIGRLDDIVGHWDPDATSEELALADEAALTFGGRRMRTQHPTRPTSED